MYYTLGNSAEKLSGRNTVYDIKINSCDSGRTADADVY
jgi:hypothetical protein